MYPIKSKSVSIHSSLVDGGLFKNSTTGRKNLIGFASIRLWYYLREQDRDGRGWVIFNPKKAATEMGCSIETLRRYIRLGHLYFLWNSVTHLATDSIRIYYKGLEPVCTSNGIRSLGAVTEKADSDLWSHLQVLATEAVALYWQQRSQYAIKAERRRKEEIEGQKDRKTLINAEKVFSKSSELCAGLIEVTPRFAVIKDRIIPYGTCLKTIASELGRGRRTISRRISRKYTDKIGVEPIEKRQIIQISPDYEGLVCQQEFFGETNPSDHYFRYRGKPAKACVNLYKEDRALVSAKYRRAALNRAWAKIDAAARSVGSGDNLASV